MITDFAQLQTLENFSTFIEIFTGINIANIFAKDKFHNKINSLSRTGDSNDLSSDNEFNLLIGDISSLRASANKLKTVTCGESSNQSRIDGIRAEIENLEKELCIKRENRIFKHSSLLSNASFNGYFFYSVVFSLCNLVCLGYLSEMSTTIRYIYAVFVTFSLLFSILYFILEFSRTDISSSKDIRTCSYHFIGFLVGSVMISWLFTHFGWRLVLDEIMTTYLFAVSLSFLPLFFCLSFVMICSFVKWRHKKKNLKWYNKNKKGILLKIKAEENRADFADESSDKFSYAVESTS